MRLLPTTPKTENRTDDREAHSGWSVRIATISRIPIRLHFTFLLFLAYFAVAGWGRGGLSQVGFIAGVFACVLLHELGHSLGGSTLWLYRE